MTTLVDSAWAGVIPSHEAYLCNLHVTDRLICKFYTSSVAVFQRVHRGDPNPSLDTLDKEIFNRLASFESFMYIKGKTGLSVDFNEMLQRSYDYLTAIVDRFSAIIMGAPRLRQDARTYRVEDPQVEDKLWGRSGFISTNIVKDCGGIFERGSPKTCAVNYLALRPQRACCLLELSISMQVPCLYIRPLSVGPVHEVVYLADGGVTFEITREIPGYVAETQGVQLGHVQERADDLLIPPYTHCDPLPTSCYLRDVGPVRTVIHKKTVLVGMSRKSSPSGSRQANRELGGLVISNAEKRRRLGAAWYDTRPKLARALEGLVSSSEEKRLKTSISESYLDSPPYPGLGDDSLSDTSSSLDTLSDASSSHDASSTPASPSSASDAGAGPARAFNFNNLPFFHPLRSILTVS